tara:strand:+ start:199 stop:864 length:666 start_codon:yes stop_codon:yes gene_type:complete
MPLQPFYNSSNKYEIGIDEAGRGPMFGRVYAAAAVLPGVDDFNHDLMKDSKKFTSKKKITECSNYIKEHAVAFSVQYKDPDIIDKINIREATLACMQNAVTDVLSKLETYNGVTLLVDGNDFKPYMYFDTSYKNIPHVTIKGGDNLYTSIAAASILAKVARDEYINDICEKHPTLIEHYDIQSNKGYGTKKHIEAIKTHGITSMHRKSYGICKESEITYVI